VTNRHCVADFSRLTSFKYILKMINLKYLDANLNTSIV